MNKYGKLYIVPTPLGNLEDITLRALRILSECDFIACEDTRNTSNLLKLLKVNYKKLISYHDFNESEKSSEIVKLIKDGFNIALVSDAGTPAISDPGFRLVDKAIAEKIEIISLPGPTAMITALVASGMAVHEFVFKGFPPKKKGRKTFIEEIEKSESTVIIYESVHKIASLIDDFFKVFDNNRVICIARELSKIHEEYIRGSIENVNTIVKQHKNLKGEFVIIIEGKNK